LWPVSSTPEGRYPGVVVRNDNNFDTSEQFLLGWSNNDLYEPRAITKRSDNFSPVLKSYAITPKRNVDNAIML
jgi:hypothetical protein